MRKRPAPTRSSIACRTTVLFVVVAALALAPSALGQVVISQVYGGGGNSGAPYTHDYVELFNRGTASVDVTGWSIQYTSAAGTSWGNQTTALSGMISAGGYYLVRLAGGTTGSSLPAADAEGTTNMSASNGKVALVNSTTALPAETCPSHASIVDLVGYGSANCFEGSGAAPGLSNTTAALRAGGGCTDTNDNANDFAAAAPTPRNSASPASPCGGPPRNEPVTAACGSGISTVQGSAASATVTATDPDGRVIDISITGVEPDPAPGTITRTAFTPAVAEGETASATITVDDAARPGTYSVAIGAANDDPTPQTGTCTLSVTVLGIIPIGVVQGAVDDTDDGFTHRSPFAPVSGNATGETVAIQGVIHSKRLGGTSASPQYGIFVQNTPATRDDDPRTSDGIFIFMGRFSTLLREGGGTYAPQVGDEVVLTGRVSEFFNMTQLSSARLQRVVRTGVSLELEVETFVTDPPDDLSDAGRYWERRESMRARIPAATLVVHGRDVFGSDAEVWVIRNDHPVALRADPYARRVFRDPHPLDNRPAELFDDGNGYRILLASNGIKATTGNADIHIAPARTYDTVTNSTAGAVDFTFGKYAVQVEDQIVLVPGVDPALNAPPQAPNRAEEYSAASFNVENLYDFRDDPFDGCDFSGNSGCPGVNPPFNYVPASDADYRQHLAELAGQIVNDLHSPDVILVQEAEDQDICAVTDGALACGETNNADGRPDTLQELALAVQARGGPVYAAVTDRDGADDRGIISAFMFRTDRVELLAADATHPVLGSSPQVSYRSAPLPYNADVQNPKVLNAVLPADVDRSTGTDGSNVFTRPPQVGLFRVSPGPSDLRGAVTLYAISNHFSSGPDRRVGQRREQARYNAAITAALEAGDPGARVLVGGDLNVFPRPDDPFAPGHPLFPSDQLAPLYEQGLYNLYDSLVAEVPVSAYSYIFQGQSQTLDQHFVNRALRNDFHRMRVAHVNADWPAEHAGDGPRGASDHDPSVARFFFRELLAGLRLAKVASTDAVPEGAVVTYTITARNDGPDAATNVVVTDRLPAELTLLGVQASQGTCTGTTEISCSLGTLASGATARVWIDARTTRAGTVTNTAETRAEQRDPDISNNTATATVRVDAAVEPPPPPPPPDTRCRIDVGPKVLVAGRKARVRVSIRMVATREPAANVVVRLRGAGVSKSVRTSAGGTARVVVRPKRVGAVRVTAPELTRCSTRISVRRAPRPAPPPELTGRS